MPRSVSLVRWLLLLGAGAGLFALGYFLGSRRSAEPEVRPVTVGDVSNGTGNRSDSDSDDRPRNALANTKLTEPREATMEEVLELAKGALAEMDANLVDYTATLQVQERIGNRLLPQSEFFAKIRRPLARTARTKQESEATETRNAEVAASDSDALPEDDPGTSVYLRYTKPTSIAGREVIWIQNRNNGNLSAHEGGLLGIITVSISPTSTLAMRDSLYPITEIGLYNLAARLIERGQEDVGNPTTKVTLIPNHRVGDRNCLLIQVKRTKPSDTAPNFSLAEIAIDQERNLPLRYSAFGWPENSDEEPPLLESYTYLNVETNVGLGDGDFDVKNPEYKFP